MLAIASVSVSSPLWIGIRTETEGRSAIFSNYAFPGACSGLMNIVVRILFSGVFIRKIHDIGRYAASLSNPA
jgi:hypothetical protein